LTEANKGTIADCDCAFFLQQRYRTARRSACDYLSPSDGLSRPIIAR